MTRTDYVEFECPCGTDSCEGDSIEVTLTDPGEAPSGMSGPPEFSSPGYGPTFDYEVPTKCSCGQPIPEEVQEKLEGQCKQLTEDWDFSPEEREYEPDDDDDRDRGYDYL